MQFSGKIGRIIGWRPLSGYRPLLWEILDPPLKSKTLKESFLMKSKDAQCSSYKYIYSKFLSTFFQAAGKQSSKPQGMSPEESKCRQSEPAVLLDRMSSDNVFSDVSGKVTVSTKATTALRRSSRNHASSIAHGKCCWSSRLPCKL